jgi:hypothetical protein
MISVSCGTEVMAESEQMIIKQEVEKSILSSPIGGLRILLFISF